MRTWESNRDSNEMSRRDRMMVSCSWEWGLGFCRSAGLQGISGVCARPRREKIFSETSVIHASIWHVQPWRDTILGPEKSQSWPRAAWLTKGEECRRWDAEKQSKR